MVSLVQCLSEAAGMSLLGLQLHPYGSHTCSISNCQSTQGDRGVGLIDKDPGLSLEVLLAFNCETCEIGQGV